MSTPRLYHNADCSKCRAALALLLDHGVSPMLVSYLDHPPSVADLRALLVQLGEPARALLRDTDDEARQLGLDDPRLSDEAILEALHARPRLLQRPILVIGERAVIARPPERVLELL